MTRKQKSFFDAARAVSELSDFPKVHIGCVVTDGNHRIISSGCNSTKTHPLQKQLNKERFDEDTNHFLHAEVVALLPLIKDDTDFNKVKLYVHRTLQNGNLGLARPCKSCMRLIRELGIKDIFFTTYDGYAHEEIIYDEQEDQ